MNGIDRIGQKVVCVVPVEFWLLGICISMPAFPRQDRTYTVAGFEDSSGHPGIHLQEIAGIDCPCRKLTNTAWPLSAFRPVNERKTDISQFESLLKTDKTPVRELEPV